MAGMGGGGMTAGGGKRGSVTPQITPRMYFSGIPETMSFEECGDKNKNDSGDDKNSKVNQSPKKRNKYGLWYVYLGVCFGDVLGGVFRVFGFCENA